MAVARFSVSARADMWEIFTYIARDKPVAASRWVDSIEEKCDFISATANFGERRPDFGADIRSHVVGRYVIFFRYIENGIEVVRVVAGDRDTTTL
jgi:toxin ParE1/3/4